MIQQSGRTMRIQSLWFLYSAEMEPPICSTSVLAMDSPKPVEVLALSTV